MMSENPVTKKRGKDKKEKNQPKRMSGYVKFFNSNKGYGFIIPDSQDYEVFVHHTAIKSCGGFRSLAEGEYVEFDVVEGPKGMQASNVSGYKGENVIGDPNAARMYVKHIKSRNYQRHQAHNSLDSSQQWYMPTAYPTYSAEYVNYYQQWPPYQTFYPTAYFPLERTDTFYSMPYPEMPHSDQPDLDSLQDKFKKVQIRDDDGDAEE